jgi:hypothetical protein
MEAGGDNLKVFADLTALAFTTTLQIYQYLYERYWPKSEKRFLTSVRPRDRGDLDHTRDIASAAGAAVV